MEVNYKKETNLPISNEDIITKINFGSLDKVIDQTGTLHILYKTICIPTQKIYVGIHSIHHKKKDNYLGCGVNSNHANFGKFGISHFKRSIDKYGASAFKREDLLYFSSRDDLFRAEQIIVDLEFVNDPRTLNCCLGGMAPPRKLGKENGNFGNHWSEEKKQAQREYFAQNRNNKGKSNPNATPVLLINLIKQEQKLFDCIADVSAEIKIDPGTVSKFLALDRLHIYQQIYRIAKPDEFDDSLLNPVGLNRKQLYWYCWFHDIEPSIFNLTSKGNRNFNLKKIRNDFNNQFKKGD